MKNSHDRKLHILPSIFAIPIIAIFLLTFSVNIKAASDQDYFPMEQNKNNHFGQNEINTIASTFNDDDYYIFVMYRDYNYFLIRYPKADKTSGMICGEKSNNLQTFSLYQVGSLSSVQAYQFQFLYGNIINQQNLNPPFNYFQNLPSSNYNSAYDYISNFIVFTNNTAAKQIVLLYDVEPEYSDQENDTYPNNFDKPDLNNYMPDWSNEPIFDSSSVENALSSIFNYFKWFAGNLKDTLSGGWNFLADLISWGLQKTIDNIRSKLEDIKTSIQGISSSIISGFGDVLAIAGAIVVLGTDSNGVFSVPVLVNSLFVPSVSDVVNVFIQNDELGILNFGSVCVATIHTIYTSITSVTPIHTLHVPSCTWHGEQIGDFDIDFSWFNTYKPYTDGVISAFLIFGYVWWLIVSAKNHIRGTFIDDFAPTQDDSYSRHNIGF